MVKTLNFKYVDQNPPTMHCVLKTPNFPFINNFYELGFFKESIVALSCKKVILI